jgi:hypothetical protein
VRTRAVWAIAGLITNPAETFELYERLAAAHASAKPVNHDMTSIEENTMKTVFLTAVGLSFFSVALGCGSAAGTEPHAMSASDHEAMASQEEKSSETHGVQYDPAASATKKACAVGRGAACWTSTTNPTAQHEKDSAHHRELAAQHRAGSEALRNAEASACSGVPEEDRDESPFDHPDDIRSVSPLREDVKLGKSNAPRMAGAEVVFAAVPGMTAEWLQRVVDCHLARNAAIGHETAAGDMPYCPLTLRGAQARVRSVGDGFAVAIRSDDTATAEEILRRAESLRAGAGK